jgi:hypothetical protein
METLEKVLSVEPEHAAARVLLERLRDAAFPIPEPHMAPETDPDEARDQELMDSAPRAVPPPEHISSPDPTQSVEPSYMLDDAPLPQRYGVDECVALAVDPYTLLVYWEISEGTLTELRAREAEPAIEIRVIAVEPSWTGPKSTVRDRRVASAFGELFLDGLPSGSVVRAAVGVRRGDEFFPIAHGPPVEIPPSGPAPLVGEKLVRWTVHGAQPIPEDQEPCVAIGRVVHRIRQDSASAWRQVQPVRALPAPVPFGGSERLVGADPSPP